MTPASSWRITERRGQTALRDLKDNWRRLYLETPDRQRYHLYQACAAFVDHLCPSWDSFRLLTLMHGDELRGICPLIPRTVDTLGAPMPVWSLPWHLHWLVTDVLCPDDDARRQFLPVVVRHLSRHAEGRPILLIGPAQQQSALWEGLHALRPSSYCIEPAMSSAVLDCRLSYDDLMGRLSKHFRRNLRSHRRKLLELVDVQFLTHAETDDAAAALETFLHIEASGWKGTSGKRSAISLNPCTEAFYGDLVRHGVEDADRCELNALHVGDICIASQLCMRNGSTYTILKIAYDEAFARLGPGQLLLAHTIERCCADPAIHRLDLVSDAGWCSDWHTDALPMQQAYIAIGRLSGIPSVSLLRFRFGPLRRLVRGARARSGGTHDAQTGRACYEGRPEEAATTTDTTRSHAG
ncbi:MAG: GNAT family N-acetyltransferase [Thermoleophilia bacterium]